MKHKLQWNTNCDETQTVIDTQIVMEHNLWWNTNWDETQIGMKNQMGVSTKCDEVQNYQKLWQNTKCDKTQNVIT